MEGKNTEKSPLQSDQVSKVSGAAALERYV